MKKAPLSSPDAVAAEKRRKRYEPDVWRDDLVAGAAEMTRIVKRARDLSDLAQAVGDLYADLYDASYRASGNGAGFERPIGTGDFSVTDPTGEVATSGKHKRMRSQVKKAVRLLTRDHWCRKCGTSVRGIPSLLEEADGVMGGAFTEQDPEFQEKLRRLRQLEKEIAGQTELPA